MAILPTPWSPPKNSSPLKEQDVHIWQASLNYSEQEMVQFITLLSSDETDRAKRFHFARDRIRYVVARGILRKILGNYLCSDPQEVKIKYDPRGKPHCENSLGLQFNLSHSQDKVLYAFTKNRMIGIDVEFIDANLQVDALANRFFSVREADELGRLTGEKKIRAFFNSWTRKEAFLKALGEGLSYSLKRIEVSMMPNQPVKILAIEDSSQDIEDWSLYSLDQIPNFAGALAVKGKDLKLIFI